MLFSICLIFNFHLFKCIPTDRLNPIFHMYLLVALTRHEPESSTVDHCFFVTYSATTAWLNMVVVSIVGGFVLNSVDLLKFLKSSRKNDRCGTFVDKIYSCYQNTITKIYLIASSCSLYVSQYGQESFLSRLNCPAMEPRRSCNFPSYFLSTRSSQKQIKVSSTLFTS